MLLILILLFLFLIFLIIKYKIQIKNFLIKNKEKIKNFFILVFTLIFGLILTFFLKEKLILFFNFFKSKLIFFFNFFKNKFVIFANTIKQTDLPNYLELDSNLEFTKIVNLIKQKYTKEQFILILEDLIQEIDILIPTILKNKEEVIENFFLDLGNLAEIFDIEEKLSTDLD